MTVATVSTLRPRCEPSARPAPPVIDVLDAADDEAWDYFVRQTSGGTIFHLCGWKHAVYRTFGHEPIYLAARRGGRIVAELPLFRVRSLLGGTMLISVPYAVYGGVLGDDAEAVSAILEHAAGLADQHGARCLELRSEHAIWPTVPVVDRYASFRRRLPDRPEDVLGWLPRKARAAARAARDKHDLNVSFGQEHLRRVWRLYCDSMRRLGSLNYPFRFFEELAERFVEQHIVSLVCFGDRPVAGLVTFLFNGVAMPYFVGADSRFHQLNINNFIYLTAMERAVELGCHTFDFGRSRIDNEGACAFKRHHGFTPTPLEYQIYTPAGRKPVNLSPNNPKFAVARKLWPLLPSPIARSFGAWLTRHIPG